LLTGRWPRRRPHIIVTIHTTDELDASTRDVSVIDNLFGAFFILPHNVTAQSFSGLLEYHRARHSRQFDQDITTDIAIMDAEHFEAYKTFHLRLSEAGHTLLAVGEPPVLPEPRWVRCTSNERRSATWHGGFGRPRLMGAPMRPVQPTP
jgi:hypothetical protein